MVEGAKLLEAAFDSGAEVESIYVECTAHRDGALDRSLEAASRLGVRIFELAPGVLERVADTVTPQPVLAVVRMPKHSLTDLEACGLVVVCVDVRDPGNAGAVIRAADASGAQAVVCCEGTVDPFNPKAVRASAGAVLRTKVIKARSPRVVLEDLRALGFKRVGALAHGGAPFTEAIIDPPLALVLGNEAAGLPVEVTGLLDGLVTVPMAEGAESLNVSMAAAVLCFEVARRRSNLHPDAVNEAEETLSEQMAR